MISLPPPRPQRYSAVVAVVAFGVQAPCLGFDVQLERVVVTRNGVSAASHAGRGRTIFQVFQSCTVPCYAVFAQRRNPTPDSHHEPEVTSEGENEDGDEPEVTSQGENEDGDEPSDDRSTRSGRWAVWTFRVLITAAAVMLFNQAILAGQFMSGTFEALEFHAFGATVSEVLVALAIFPAGWARFRRRYPLWPAVGTALLFVAINVQEFAGEERILTLHVPLGVSIIVVVSGFTVWAWRQR
jgi:hypothetical protein